MSSAIAVVAIAVLALTAFTSLLSLDRQRGHGPCFQALDTDLFAGFETIAVGAVLDAFQRLVDLTNELALTITRAQLEAEFFFLGRAGIGVGKIRSLVLHVRDRAIDFLHQIALPIEQDQLEMRQLLLAHVLLATLGDIG